MILVRSVRAAGALQASLLAKNIPYSFIGGVKLLESAHVRDLLSVLRLVANPRDEIGWMRFLTLWEGVGDVTASRLIDRIMLADDLDQCLQLMSAEPKLSIPHETQSRVVGFSERRGKGIIKRVLRNGRIIGSEIQASGMGQKTK